MAVDNYNHYVNYYCEMCFEMKKTTIPSNEEILKIIQTTLEEVRKEKE